MAIEVHRPRITWWRIVVTTCIGVGACWLVPTATAFGQTVPDAFKGEASLWAGGEFANFEAGFPQGSSLRLSGEGGFLTYNLTHAFALEGHARVLNLNSWYGETEQDYLGGARYTFLHNNKWRPFASFEVGVVRIQYPFNIGTGDLFAFVPGGGLEYRLSHRWSTRTAYEFQILPNSPDFTDEPHFGMRPNGVYAGISYRIF